MCHVKSRENRVVFSSRSESFWQVLEVMYTALHPHGPVLPKKNAKKQVWVRFWKAPIVRTRWCKWCEMHQSQMSTHPVLFQLQQCIVSKFLSNTYGQDIKEHNHDYRILTYLKNSGCTGCGVGVDGSRHFIGNLAAAMRGPWTRSRSRFDVLGWKRGASWYQSSLEHCTRSLTIAYYNYHNIIFLISPFSSAWKHVFPKSRLLLKCDI